MEAIFGTDSRAQNPSAKVPWQRNLGCSSNPGTPGAVVASLKLSRYAPGQPLERQTTSKAYIRIGFKFNKYGIPLPFSATLKPITAQDKICNYLPSSLHEHKLSLYGEEEESVACGH